MQETKAYLLQRFAAGWAGDGYLTAYKPFATKRRAADTSYGCYTLRKLKDLGSTYVAMSKRTTMSTNSEAMLLEPARVTWHVIGVQWHLETQWRHF